MTHCLSTLSCDIFRKYLKKTQPYNFILQCLVAYTFQHGCNFIVFFKSMISRVELNPLSFLFTGMIELNICWMHRQYILQVVV